MAPLTKALWGSAIVASVAGLAFGLGDHNVLGGLPAPRRFGVWVALLSLAAGLGFGLRGLIPVACGTLSSGLVLVVAAVVAPTPGDEDTAALLGVIHLGYVPVLFLLVAAVGAGVHAGIAHLSHIRSR